METAPQRLKGSSYAETRSAVLDLIRSASAVSRVELARRSGLTEGTISKITRELLDEGVIETAGTAASTGGKRPTLLRLSASARYALGVTLDTSAVVIALCGLDGAPVAQTRVAGVGSQDPQAAVDRVADEVEALLAGAAVAPSAVIGVGLSASGRRGGSSGWEVDPVPAEAWERFGAGSVLSRRLGLPVTVENDANCAALGVFWSNGHGSSRAFMTVYLSHGIGAGIVIGGGLYRGASGNAGEIGHVVVEPDGRPCWCGGRGCLETVATPRAIVDRVLGNETLRDLLGVDAGTGRFEVHRCVLSAAERGEAAAVDLLEESARRVGEVVLGLVNCLDLDAVHLAGPGFGSASDLYVDELRRLLAVASRARGDHPVEVRFAGGGPVVAALGAASVVLHRNLTPHHALAALR